MKKLFCLLLVFVMAIPVFAQITVKGQAPTVSGTGSDVFNQAVAEAFDNIITELNKQFMEVEYSNPSKLLRGFGNSSVYASHGATTRGYGGYKLFSATIGLMVGIELPESITSIMDDLENISGSLEKEGDIKLGVSPNIFNAHIGLNMSMFKFLPEHIGIIKRDSLYVGLRIGYFKLPDIVENFNYSSFTLGLTANYQIIPSVSLASLATWRGLNIGSGIIYNGAKVSFTAPLGESIEEPILGGASHYGASLVLDPEASIKLNVNTVIIPLEAVTAIKLLIFNIPLGVGADISFGKTSLGFGVASDVQYKNLPSNYKEDKKGDFHVDAGASNTPFPFNFKIMTGLGISAGPVVFDIPITYYPASGYNIGITIGAVF